LVRAVVAAVCLCASLGEAADPKPIFHGYFANWAQYHAKPYDYRPADLKILAPKMDFITYSFAFFCPDTMGVKGGKKDGPTPTYWLLDRNLCNESNPMDIVAPEPNDAGEESGGKLNFMADVTDFKKDNENLKVILSIGGWNFPSAYFSQMVSTKEYRTKWIASTIKYMKSHNFDGIDIDWEYPCSEPRADPIKMDCETFNVVLDDGAMEYTAPDTSCTKDDNGDWKYCADCPDKANLLLLVQEMRAAYDDAAEDGEHYYITVASQAGLPKMQGGFNVPEMTKAIDWWNIMSYDYSVSDTPFAKYAAINQPVYNTSADNIPDKWSMNYTIHGYLDLGVDPQKMMIGIALYAHTWFVPGLTGIDWHKFGLPATQQKACCGPFRGTYGAKAGAGCALCGSMMYSEVMAANCAHHFDTETASDMMYCNADGDDKYTKNGTFISYNSEKSYCEISQLIKKNGLKGGFVFDTSMDTLEDGKFTYGISGMLADDLHGDSDCSKQAFYNE